MECGVIYKLVEPFQSFVFGSVKEYVGYIGNCKKHLGALHKSLDDLCNKKGDIKMKVKVGTDKLEKVTRVAAHWLDDVQMLATDKMFKELMYKDIETAKFVVKLMEKKDLKRCLIEESEMQELVVKVMKKLKEEMEAREEDEIRRIIEEDYKNVGEVLVEVMKDSLEEFKNIIKQDKKMAEIAKTTLLKNDLDKLATYDQEIEAIFREVMNVSDEESRPNVEDEGSNAPLLKSPAVGVSENILTDNAKKVFTPLSYLLTPLGKLMTDAKFKKAVPMADSVKLGLEVIDGLLIKSPGFKKDIMGDNAERRHRSCCCCSSLSLCDYHGHYQISKAAEAMAKLIEDKISKCPTDYVTSSISSANLKPIPTKFLEGLDSRTNLMHQILEKLEDDEVPIVGVFGMGGAGKTVLAKEVRNADKRIFSIKVMVEVSDTPDIIRIQGAIAESIGLPLREVNNIDQRAKRIYNRLVSEKKPLIILDNIWKWLDLTEIGIPDTCKLLLTTREREVCRVMDVSNDNILEVGLMNTNEARELFKRHAGNQVDVGEFKEVVQRLLSKCGGLPLAVVAAANALKNKSLSSWRKFANDMERPISSQFVTGDYRHMYSILNASYKFIECKEKKIFFLLACLSPLCSSASIENLMRYGIGLNLFQHVNTLCEAMEEANTWTSELLSSSMLLEGDAEGYFKIHDIVRAFGISLAAKEECHKFMVEDIPRWLDDETLNTYTGISLMSANDYSSLSGMKAYMLRILILKGGQSPYIDDLFFKGMVNLEVLVLKYMNFELKLPGSVSKLKKLRTLCMERCKLGDIKQVGELVNLLVLSLRGSFVKELPNEIGELSKLRLLDLNGCMFSVVPLIPVGILGRLSKLEGLYLYNNKCTGPISEIQIDDEGNGKSENQNNTLPCLNAFEITISKIKELAIDGESLRNLNKFRVCIGNTKINSNIPQEYCRVLYLHADEIMADELGRNGLDVLLKKADKLSIVSPKFTRNTSKYFENLVPLLDPEGFRDLKSLKITGILTTCIVKGCAMKNLIAFPSLRALNLMYMKRLKVVCDRDAPLEMFSNLQTLRFEGLPSLFYGLPLVPPNLEVIYVNNCPWLKFIFLKDEEPQIMDLPFLKTLKLYSVPHLSSLVGPKNFSETPFEAKGYSFDGELLYGLPLVPRNLEVINVSHCSSLNFIFLADGEPQLSSLKGCNVPLSTLLDPKFLIENRWEAKGILFDGKIAFSSLELLHLSGCDNVMELWGCGVYRSGFQNLKDVIIENCVGLLSVGPPSLFSFLVQLETLRIKSCDQMCEVICREATRESEISEKLIGFPRLKCLELSKVYNLETLYGGGFILEFPELKKLILDTLPCMKNLTKSENSEVLFHQNMVLPCLEELQVSGVSNVAMRLWDSQVLITEKGSSFSNPASNLRRLTLGSSAGLRHIPSTILEELSSLVLNPFGDDNVAIFSSSEYGDNEGFVSTNLQLPKLEELKVENSKSLKVLFENCEEADATMFCGMLKTLELIKLGRMNMIPLHLFKVLSSLTLYHLNWEYLISADVLGNSLQQLEFLEIAHCCKMETVAVDVVSTISLPRLKKLIMKDLETIKSFSNPPTEGEVATFCLPSLELLQIDSCRAMEYFWSGSIVAPKLQQLYLDGCSKLEQLFKVNPEHSLEFSYLRQVSIRYCYKIMSIFSVPFTAPKLREVKLDACFSLPCFFPDYPVQNGKVQLPYLEIVEISCCDCFRSFSFAPSVAPNLYHIQYEGEEYSMLPYDYDLNKFLNIQVPQHYPILKDHDEPVTPDEPVMMALQRR